MGAFNMLKAAFTTVSILWHPSSSPAIKQCKEILYALLCSDVNQGTTLYPLINITC